MIHENRKSNTKYQLLKQANRIRNCSENLERLAYQQSKGAFLGCRSALCPICRHIRVTRELAITHGILDHILDSEEHRGIKLYHWVLTTESCSVHRVVAKVQELRQGFCRLTKMPEVARVLLGASCYLHIKLGDYGEVKPHLHVAVLLRSSFRGKRFISKHRLGLLWQEALGVGYAPYVNAIPIPLLAGDGSPERRHFINLVGYMTTAIELQNIRDFPDTYFDFLEQGWGLRKVRHVGLMADLRRTVKADHRTRVQQAKVMADQGLVMETGTAGFPPDGG